MQIAMLLEGSVLIWINAIVTLNAPKQMIASGYLVHISMEAIHILAAFQH